MTPSKYVCDDSAESTAPEKFARPECPLLLAVTAANALAALLSIALAPDISGWMQPAKVAAYAVWTATGYASLGALAGWLAVYVGQKWRGGLSVAAGGAIAFLHATIWFLTPSWS